ncbi:hypothetical protein BCR42DRAFT_407425 [Absidia repens]|uniref:PB1 domain-containing protein n=1 Tax=Absidia repens TaxID=90262 RepID=A0A1X2IS77_9FUNG|nr:hypothetical protein BCR42DRAFT_407425 [Absidia repens]
MKNIIVTLSYGSHTDCLTITPKTTWSDLCASIFDYSRLPVTQLYYRDHEGDIMEFSSDSELDSLKQQCITGWLHLSTDPTKTVRCVFDDTFINHQCDLQQQYIPNHQYPTNSMSTPLPSTLLSAKKIPTDNTATISFTSQFEQFGKLMDKYNDLIQQEEHVKAMMHQTATEITLQKSTVNLVDLEHRLETYQNNSCKSLYPQRGKLSPGLLDNSSRGLSRSATTISSSSSSLERPIKRTPTTSLYRGYDNINDQSCAAPSNSYPDVPPPSYETQQPIISTYSSVENENEKRNRRRHTLYDNFNMHPSYSLEKGTKVSMASSSLAPPTASELHYTPPPSAPSSPLDSVQRHHHHFPRQPISLYPRPPILPALLKRTSRLLSHWVPPLTTQASPSPPRHPSHPPAKDIPPFSSGTNDSSYRSYYNNDNDIKNTYTNGDFDSSNCNRKQKGKQHIADNNENGRERNQHGFLDSRRDRQLYREQQRALRQQQKELARTRRQLKRQEKRDMKEHRSQRHRDRHTYCNSINNSNKTKTNSHFSFQQNEKQHEPQMSTYRNAGSETIRRSLSISSLSSISTLSSQSTCSSLSSSSSSSSSSSPPPPPAHTLNKARQQQPPMERPDIQYPTIPSSLIQHRSSCLAGSNDPYCQRHDGGNAIQSLDDKLDEQDMQYLASSFDQISTTTTKNDPPVLPSKQ